MKLLLLLVATAQLVCLSEADIYMHNPPGSNDRNRERNANRNNDNRLFDSQNNAAGGYPWRGDPEITEQPDPITYFSGSTLQLKWTQQHGCGGNPSTHCTILLQYACDTQLPGIRDGYPTGSLVNQGEADGGANNDNDQDPTYKQAQFSTNNQDGTTTIPNDEDSAGCSSTVNGGIFDDDHHGTCTPCDENLSGCEYGMHEDYYYYNVDCVGRERNGGLYTADRDLTRTDARSTRQNPNGNRYGFECPEERDYYPYWHPTPWVDIAVITSEESWCDYYRENSQNVQDRYYCNYDCDSNGCRPIEQQACETLGGSWDRIPSFGVDAPDCLVGNFTEQNHLGFTESGADYDGYTWTIPEMADGETRQCVIRLRYNISTEDYPAMAGFSPSSGEDESGGIVDSRYNCNEDGTAISSTDGDTVDDATANGDVPLSCQNKLSSGQFPRWNRPEVEVFDGESVLSIALNTDQSGRTFQDRSYVFQIGPRPSDIPSDAVIHNLNMMGKRGNIVQSYPAIEYEFVPRHLHVEPYDYVNVQFHGSDFNQARNPNNAEGFEYTDRTNLMEMADLNHQFPLHEDSLNFFSVDDAKEFGLLGQAAILEAKGYECKEEDEVDDDDNDPRLCGKLNAAPNTFQKYFQVSNDKAENTYKFISTRNNNFSNRKQTMSITVGDRVYDGYTAAQAAGMAVGATLGVFSGGVVVLFVLAGFGILGDTFKRRVRGLFVRQGPAKTDTQLSDQGGMSTPNPIKTGERMRV